MRAMPGVLVALLAMSPGAHAADPSALWKIVNGQCVPHEEATRDPSPCAAVDLADGVEKGFVVLKDINGIAQFLLIPTARIGGMEDPAILAPHQTNFWDAAWRARHFVDERLHTSLPRDAVSLAINSAVGRTQNQLHIHIDCVRPDVHQIIAANIDKTSDAWTPFPIPLAGQMYRSIRINQPSLDAVDPFHILADGDPQAAGDMGMHTLVLLGTKLPDGADGFILLDNQADLPAGDRASGEQLQDHSCAIAAN